ncbi:hypothetical protein ABPG72_013924 [Tetrahymena utriculariae]
MRPARGKSNPKAPLASQQLELETKKMEEKLAYLKAQMEVEKKKKEDQLRTSGSRWKSSTAAQPIKNYANMVIDAKKQNEKTTKIDYAKMNKEFGQKMAQKSSLKNTSSSMSSIQRPSSNTQSSRQKENQSSNDLNKSLNGSSFQQSSSKGMIGRKNSRESSQIKQSKAVLTPFLEQFLEETNLVKFTDVFLNNGYSNEDQIKQINTDVLNKMGIPPGFQIKIMKRINTLNLNKSIDLNSTELAKKPSTNNNNITTPKSVAQKSLLEEQKANIKEKKSESPNKQIDNNNKIASRPPLLKKQPSQDLKKVRFQDKSPQIQPKIKQSTDNTGKQLFHTESTATDAQTPSDFLLKKISCWQCYSIVAEERTIQQHGKHFCKQECLKTYEDFYIVQCANKNCLKQISKQDCSYREGNWYCLGKCEPNIQQIEQMWEEQIQSTEKIEGETDEQYYERKIKEFENIDKRKKVEYDLKLSSENEKKSKILTLEEIEAKYKFINENQNID